ncbi:MAG: ATP-binding protein [Armatimonadota bacterium]
MIKELVVISGKGGTGKTSVVASFASLATEKVLVDCDVDAADLHLILEPQIEKREDFSGGNQARIIQNECIKCGKCADVCRYDAVKFQDAKYSIDPVMCEGCGVCAYFCPAKAIDFSPQVNGEWYISETRHGKIVHAKLSIAQENSGKLVTLIRTQAKQIAEETNKSLIIIDGSPGIGCPVIASITGASMVLVVTEPTLSGLHDLERVCSLAKHFNIPTMVSINKYDINNQIANEIRTYCKNNNIELVGDIRYDPEVTKAQIQGKSIVEYALSPAGEDICNIWKNINAKLEQN